MNFEPKYLKYKDKYLSLKKDKLEQDAKKNDIFIIGIAGASGCGKSYFAEKIRDELKLIYKKENQVEIISCDNYYKSYVNPVSGKNEISPPDFNWDVPEVLDLELLSNQLLEYKNDGLVLQVPKYNFKTSQRDGITTKIFYPNTKILIIEGLYILYHQKLRDIFDLKIFTLADQEICLIRRLTRDLEHRKPDNVTIEDFSNQTISVYKKNVRPSYERYVEPTREYADILVYTDVNYAKSKIFDIIKSYTINKLKI